MPGFYGKSGLRPGDQVILVFIIPILYRIADRIRSKKQFHIIAQVIRDIKAILILFIRIAGIPSIIQFSCIFPKMHIRIIDFPSIDFNCQLRILIPRQKIK